VNTANHKDNPQGSKTQVVTLFESPDPWALHRVEGEGPGPYRLAPKVQEAAQELIARYHPHLQEARIAYLFRQGSWTSRGRTVYGRARTASALWRFVSGIDLVLVLHEETWQDLGRKGRKALLDHQLSHFTPPSEDRQGYPRWGIAEQDIREFSQVIQRHGICIHGSRALQELAGQYALEALQDSLNAEENLGGEDYEEEIHDQEDGPGHGITAPEKGEKEP